MQHFRRVTPRRPVNWVGTYRFDRDPEGYSRTCKVIDISQLGTRLELCDVTLEETIGQQIVFSDELRGKVQNAVPDREGGVRVGIEFLNIPQEAQLHIQSLSIAMAALNEEGTIEEAISSVLAVDVPFEIELIVVDDGSTDRTLEIVRSISDPRLVVLSHPSRQGKGAAIRDAALVATGSHMLVFDADLEYSADDIRSLVGPVLEGASSVVYGARRFGSRSFAHSLIYGVGSKMTTLFANILFNSRLRDMHTCLKLIPLPIFRQMNLTESGFGLDTEITGELLRRGIRPQEVPCSYHGRTVAAGKKISVMDGIECFKLALQIRLRGRTGGDQVIPAVNGLERDFTSASSPVLLPAIESEISPTPMAPNVPVA